MSSRGFRMDWLDTAMLAAAAASAWWLSVTDRFEPMWWIPLYVTGTFFFFCNVFRVRPLHELVWITAFVTAMVVTVYLDADPVRALIASVPASVPASVAVVIWAAVSGGYCGVGWRYVASAFGR